MAATDRLIVTFAAEVVGSSSLIRADKESALERLEAHRHQFVDPKIAQHYGRIVKATGESLLVEFASPIGAVQCAVEVQQGMIDRNIGTAPDRRTTFRIGINLGEAMASGDDLIIRAVAALPIGNLATLMKSGAENYSGSSNIAMRLAALAEPAGICISGALRDAIRDQLPYIFEDIGDQDLDIRGASVHCYAMSADSVASRARVAAENRNHSGKRRRWLRSAAIGTSMFATVGVSAAVLWVWLGVMADNPSRPPKTQQKPQIPLASEQPVTNAVQTASRADDAAALLARGDAFLAAGDITSARLSYERAADAGSGLAALQLGASFDPVFQDRAGLRGAIAEGIQALSWYRRARKLGVGEAAQRIKALETRPLGDLYTQSR